MSQGKLGRFVAIGVAVIAAGSAAAHAQGQRLTLDPAASRVSFELPATGHDVHGLFTLRGGVIDFDPATGTASGEINVDAGSGTSGNSSRDKTMHDDVLEASRFPEIQFVARSLTGRLAESGPSEINLVGTIILHGVAHPLTLPTRVTITGARLHAETQFPVAYVDWGLKNPSIVFLRVDPVVQVKIVAEGELVTASAAGGA